MFGSVLTDFKGYLDPRFLVSIFLPSLIFCTVFIVLVAFSLGFADVLKAWGALALDVQTLIVVFYLSFIYLFSFLLSTSLGRVIRLYEGYWEDLHLPLIQSKVDGWKNRRRDFYAAKLKKLCEDIEKINNNAASLIQGKTNTDLNPEEKEKLKVNDRDESELYQERYQQYPPCTRQQSVMPTMFGNVIKGREIYPSLHYNMSIQLLWPRLFPLLKEDDHITKLLVDGRMKLESMVAISVLGLIFALAGLLTFTLFTPSWLFFLFTFWGGLLVWWLAYRSAIESAGAYGDIINVTIDLYRHKLAESLYLTTYKNLEDERKEWQKVNAFLYRNKNYGHIFDYSKLETKPAEGGKK